MCYQKGKNGKGVGKKERRIEGRKDRQEEGRKEGRKEGRERPRNNPVATPAQGISHPLTHYYFILVDKDLICILQFF